MTSLPELCNKPTFYEAILSGEERCPRAPEYDLLDCVGVADGIGPARWATTESSFLALAGQQGAQSENSPSSCQLLRGAD